MLKLLPVMVLFSAFILFAQEPVQGLSANGGLSGFPYLPESRVIPVGGLRVQGSVRWTDMSNTDDYALVAPLDVAWGVHDNIELAGEVPFYLHDPTDSDAILGDITIGCGWLYETARGGSALVLRGQLRLPTGAAGRDRGAELSGGLATSTTFRLFRLQASASYVLNGQHDPFEDSIEDYMRFSIGGASYVSQDLQVVLAMDGTSAGDLGVSCSGVLYAFDDLALFASLRAGLSGSSNAELSAGGAWTGTGF